MYIAPNSVIRILKNCPLDTTYDHTIYFDTQVEQSSYFYNLTKYTLTEQTYQRVNRARMRVQVNADNLFDCNYIMFQNTSFGNKWFYAFIRSVEYVNNITSEIEYEIDVMQTWAFDYQLAECFVDREHSVTDIVGDNLVPEKLETGEYVSEDFDATQILGPKSIVVAATFDQNYENVGGGYYGGIFSGLYFNVFENTPDGASACSNFIQNADSKTDGIVAVFLMPTAMITNTGASSKVVNIEKTKFSALKRADNTPVKNKKVLTYPYNFLYVTNLQGNHAVFPYEYFSGDNCTFIVAGDMSPNPGVVLAPTNYKGVPTNFDEKITLTGFPQLSYNTDSFKTWLGEHAGSLPINAISSVITSGISRAAAGPAGVALGIGLSVANTVGQVIDHAIMPNQAHGGGNSSTMASLGLLDFGFMHKHIRPEFVSVIDDFFNVYGYATHRVKVPNRNVRPHWTYTKTIGCVVRGSVPCDDMSKICKIYDSGITFWQNGNEIGNYSLDNSV